MTAPVFEAPGPGSWLLDDVHFSRPASRYLVSVFPLAMPVGFRAGTKHYGLLLDYIAIAFVGNFFYSQPRPVGAPPGAKGPPPKLIFQILTRLHPEMRRRVKRSAEVFEKKIWREDLAWWNDELKPQSLAHARALQAVDLEGLTADALLAHLNACREFVLFAVTNHHRLNPCNMVPLGDFLSHAQAWTGLATSDLLQLMQGASPHSGGATAELDALTTALRSDADALAVLRSDREAAEILDHLRADGGAVGDAARTYIDLIGYRIMSGYDVADLYTLEAPGSLITVIRTAVDAEARASTDVDVSAKLAAARDAVPEPHRAEFDELYTEARATYHLRDEKIMCGDALATGLTRRALQAIGRLLAETGKLDDPTHIFDATHEEIVGLLESGDGPPAAEFAERTGQRAAAEVAGAPPLLGPPPLPPPPANWFPAKSRRMQEGMDTVLMHMFRHDDRPAEGKMLHGLSASPGSYEGTARVVTGPDDFQRVEPGDVLVAKTTAPAYNVLLPMLGAVVTARGGVLSHAAVVAREYGLPAVVGCGEAMTEIADGTRVRVDGDAGAVWIEA